MAKQHLDAVLVSSIPNITYLTSFSHFSKDEREAFLFITFNKQYVLTDGRYAQAVRNNVKNFELVEISSKLTFEKALKVLAKKHKVRRVGFEQDDISVSEHKKISACFNNLTHVTQTRHSGLTGYRLVPVLSRMTQHKMSDLNHFSMKDFRAIKNAKEVSAIEEACKIGDETFKYILNRIKPGITEKQLAFEIEFFIKKNGADISFPPIVAFGANSAIPHHKPSNASLLSTRRSGDPSPHPLSLRERARVRVDSGIIRMTSGQFVLLDFGVKLNNYCSDMTRTVFFGKPTVEQKRMYQTVLEAQDRAIEHLKFTLTQFPLPSRERGRVRGASSTGPSNKILASDIDKVARDYIISHGFPTIPHSLGHGVGLEVHEAPRLSPKSKDILKPGMVFTIEPGIYIPGFGGVRIEDVVLLENNHVRLLTNSLQDLTTS